MPVMFSYVLDKKEIDELRKDLGLNVMDSSFIEPVQKIADRAFKKGLLLKDILGDRFKDE